ncbi:hypothetical protein [Roseibium album]|uniref:hypothetical protein n=1 Tax=Roseibium album TaxID=311410 RepID=UPI00391ACC81
MADITLSSAVRKNLNSLQSTASFCPMSRTNWPPAEGQFCSGNPSNFFTASGLVPGERPQHCSRLGQSVQTLKAADEELPRSDTG